MNTGNSVTESEDINKVATSTRKTDLQRVQPANKCSTALIQTTDNSYYFVHNYIPA